MSPTDLEELLQEHFTDRLRVMLSSGDEVIIEQPQRTIISGLSLYVQMFEDSASRMGRRVRVISIPNINLIEPMRPGRNGRRPRGPRR
jgi:hypothetical protein